MRSSLYWYVMDTPGPTILGLPSSKKLAVMKMNCAITTTQPGTKPQCSAPVSTTVAITKPVTAPEAAKSISSTDDLIKEFPDWFTGIGRFPGKYKIWLHRDAHPVIHAPRKGPIALYPKVKEPLDKMEHLGMITHVDKPIDWVSSITHVQKGKWQAMAVLGSPWPQQGHLPRSSQDTNCRGSHSRVCTLSLLHQVGCLPWILVNHPQPGL